MGDLNLWVHGRRLALTPDLDEVGEGWGRSDVMAPKNPQVFVISRTVLAVEGSKLEHVLDAQACSIRSQGYLHDDGRILPDPST